MNETPWVNWQQFASLNEEETKRTEEDRQRARADEQEKFLGLTGQLQTEAQGQAGARQFAGLDKIGKFQDVIKARDEALSVQKNQPVGSPWEGYLDPGKNAPYKSPWADLDKKLGTITAAAQQTQKGAVQRVKDQEDAAYRAQQAKIKQQQDAVAAAEKAKDSAATKARFDAWVAHSGFSNIRVDKPGGGGAELWLRALENWGGVDLSDPYVRTQLSNRGIYPQDIDRYLASKSAPPSGKKE